MKILFLLSGGYGAGKTHYCRSLVGPSNTVALAGPIRSDLFKIFLDDRIHSTDQKVKEALFGKSVLDKGLKKQKVSKVSKPVLDRFHQILDKEDLTRLTTRDILKLYGDAGRQYRKQYWVQRTCKLLEGKESNLLAVDDVRFVNELEGLKKWADKNGYKVQHYFVGPPDGLYENSELFTLADYRIDWRKGEDST